MECTSNIPPTSSTVTRLSSEEKFDGKISTLWFLSGSNWRWVLLEQGQQRQQLSNLSQEEKIGGRWGKLYTEYFSYLLHQFSPEYSPEICTDCAEKSETKATHFKTFLKRKRSYFSFFSPHNFSPRRSHCRYWCKYEVWKSRGKLSKNNYLALHCFSPGQYWLTYWIAQFSLGKNVKQRHGVLNLSQK